MNEDKCILCNEKVEMMFNTPIHLNGEAYMLTAPICLKCWSSYEDDQAVVKAIMEKIENERREKQTQGTERTD
jgi:hypothetical protein